MTTRVLWLLRAYAEQYDQVHCLRWSTFMNRYEALFGRLVLPSFSSGGAKNLLFAIFDALDCTVVDCVNRHDWVLRELVRKGRFRLPEVHGLNQLCILLSEREHLERTLCELGAADLDASAVAIAMNTYHREFVPLSFLLSARMLDVGGYANAMLSADTEPDDWTHSRAARCSA